MSHLSCRGLLLLGALALGPACVHPYVPAVDKDRMAHLSIRTEHIGTLPGPTITHNVEVDVHNLRSGCGSLDYQGFIRVTKAAAPITTLPANELIGLVGSWREGGLFAQYSCDAGSLFLPEHGKSYVFVFTGPAKPGPAGRRLTCSADIFEFVASSGDTAPLVPVPSAFLPGTMAPRDNVCAVGKQVVQQMATLKQDRARSMAEAAAARESGEAAARAGRPTPPGSLLKAR